MRGAAAEKNVVKFTNFLPPFIPLVSPELVRKHRVRSMFSLPARHKKTEVRHLHRHYEPESLTLQLDGIDDALLHINDDLSHSNARLMPGEEAKG
jgi:hypothetical protein